MKNYEGALENFKAMKSIYSGFMSGGDNFPVEECRNESEFEKNVFDGENFYYVVVCDDRFDDYAYIVKAKPYIYVEEDSKKSYGWVDGSGNVINCAFNPIADYDTEYVCAWRIAE